MKEYQKSVDKGDGHFNIDGILFFILFSILFSLFFYFFIKDKGDGHFNIDGKLNPKP